MGCSLNADLLLNVQPGVIFDVAVTVMSLSSHLQFHSFTISVRVTLAVSAGDRFGDSEAVVPTGPLLCHPSAL